ncbi:hypothetical protein HPC38_02480 [Pasteurellaceae bacterium HPA106]|uniref:hypothetical protein n=1 Tax=Spirabiliibacterium pneumoniae TaxID=221400 RepID=UPI001AADE209|nr:hypothetical protein [Spirabiliibacterium pneumoniae]MBE2895746.1 hypothetical protein [Spirabiliibacterium pneumoniae]
MDNLILSIESKVVACNVQDFKKQAEKYLLSLTSEFETDDDFANAKNEIKELKELESKTKEAIEAAETGNSDVAISINIAKDIVEQFRQERLKREKIVKEKEKEVKERIVDQAYADVSELYKKLPSCSTVSLALSRTITTTKIFERLIDATARKKTISGLEAAINAEKQAIIADITTEVSRLKGRLEQLPIIAYQHLFKDDIDLICSDVDLEPIVKERIEKEQALIEQKAKELNNDKKSNEVADSEVTVKPKNIKLESDDNTAYQIIFTLNKNVSYEMAKKIGIEMKKLHSDSIAKSTLRGIKQ